MDARTDLLVLPLSLSDERPRILLHRTSERLLQLLLSESGHPRPASGGTRGWRQLLTHTHSSSRKFQYNPMSLKLALHEFATTACVKTLSLCLSASLFPGPYPLLTARLPFRLQFISRLQIIFQSALSSSTSHMSVSDRSIACEVPPDFRPAFLVL